MFDKTGFPFLPMQQFEGRIGRCTRQLLRVGSEAAKVGDPSQFGRGIAQQIGTERQPGNNLRLPHQSAPSFLRVRVGAIPHETEKPCHDT